MPNFMRVYSRVPIGGSGSLRVNPAPPGASRYAAAMDKDQSIIEVLARLQERLGADAFQIIDHSEGADLVSTGVAHPADPQWLVYISTWKSPGGRYSIELELPPAPDDDFPYVSGGWFHNLDFEQLLEHIKEHFAQRQ
jgi:hypothetical protein